MAKVVLDVFYFIGAFVGIIVDFQSIPKPVPGEQIYLFPRYNMFLINIAVAFCGIIFLVWKEYAINKKKEDLRRKPYYHHVSISFIFVAFAGHALLLGSFFYRSNIARWEYFRDEHCWFPIFLSFLLSALPSIWKNLRVSSFKKVEAFFTDTKKKDERRKREEKLVEFVGTQASILEVTTDIEMKSIEKKVYTYLQDHPSSKKACAAKLGISSDQVAAIIKKNKNQYSYNPSDKCWWTTEVSPIVEEQPLHDERLPAEPINLDSFQIRLLSLINGDNGAPLWDFAKKMSTTRRKIKKSGIQPLMQLELIRQDEDKMRLTDVGLKYLNNNAIADNQAHTPAQT